MSVLNRLACSLGYRDEVPNQELARELAGAKDKQGIKEIAENLWNQDVHIQNDCIKVLYTIGQNGFPDLIADYWPDYLKLLKSRNNRLVWGAMIAISTIAEVRASELFAHREKSYRRSRLVR